jgi:hypothetical protein
VVTDGLSRRPRIFSLVPLRVNLREHVLTQLQGDSWYLKVTSNLQSGRQLDPKYEGYSLETDRLLRYRGRMYIPENGDIRSIILKEAHRALYCVHPGVKKMYADIRKLFFWVGMKRDVVHFIAKCLDCQQVKADHHHRQASYNHMMFLCPNGKSFLWILLWGCRSHPIDTMPFL